MFFWFPFHRVFFVLPEKRARVELEEDPAWEGGVFLGETEPFFFTDHGILEVSYHLCTLQWCI